MNESSLPPLGVVAIGRNEAPDLERCLRSAGAGERPVVYVDSGSSDGSAALAGELGATVVALDAARPFSAARARNAGFERLKRDHPEVAFVQFVDGDCELAAGWMAEAAVYLADHPGAAVVCGRRRERFPEASIYNRLLDLEWDRPAGEVEACGGDAMMRVEAFEAAGGFDPAVVAGEEPELCHRLRTSGWRIHRLAGEMTLHDGKMTRAAAWWRRGVRSGLAWAEAAANRRGRARRASLGIWAWVAGLPLATAVLVAWFGPAGLWLLLALPWQWLRVASRQHHRRGRPWRLALLYSAHCLAAKAPQAWGELRWLARRATGRTPHIIEYRATGRDAP